MTPLTQALNTALLHFVWQGIVVGFLLGTLLYLLRRSSANARYAAGCGALALLAIAPVVTAWIAYAPQTASEVSWTADSVIAALPSSGSLSPLNSGRTFGLGGLEAWLLPAWAIGVSLFALRLAWCWGHTAALRRSGNPADGSFIEIVSRAAERVGVSRGVRVLMSSVAEVPSVIGWIRPVLLLPVAVAAGLTPQQLEAVIAHELAHIRRHDYFVNLLQTVVETVLFYHPAVWWVSSRIRYERELCCDDVAVAATGDVAGYARALAKLESLRMPQSSLAMGAADGPLFHRIERLLGGDGRQHGPSRLACAVGLIVGMSVLALNMSWAQERQGVGGERERTFEYFVAPQPPQPPMPPMPPRAPRPPQVPAVPSVEPRAQSLENMARLADSLKPSWVLFTGDQVMSGGSSPDQSAARAARESAGGGDLLWFRHEGKAYVTQDKATLALIAGRSIYRIAASLEAEKFLAQEEQRMIDSQIDMRREQERAIAKLQEEVRHLASMMEGRDGLTPSARELQQMILKAQDLQMSLDMVGLASFRERAVRERTAIGRRREDAVRANEVALRTLLELLREAVSSGKARPIQ